MKDKNEPLLEFQLGNATYERIDHSDGSNRNAMAIDHIQGWNLLPNALYPEIIGPFKDPQHKPEEKNRMLQLYWVMLEAIAGIPVLEEFQVTVHPLKIQLERSLGKALFEYIFPGIGSSAFDNGGFSPLMVKNMKPIETEDDEENEQARNIVSPKQDLAFPDQHDMKDHAPGAIGSRLQPTYNLKRVARASTASSKMGKSHGFNTHRIGLFGHRDKDQNSKDAPADPSIRRQSSSQSLGSFRSRKRNHSTSSVNLESTEMARQNSREGRGLRLRRHDSNIEKEKKKGNDDVSQMVARASNYMTLAHVRLNSFVLCLSYKGQRDRNLEDLHDFVFRMPPLEYRNKTWSNLDLALHLKKDVIRALISHTGAIFANKLSHHRPGKKQAEKIREYAAKQALLPNSDTLVNTPSVSSDRSSVLTDLYDNYTPPRLSFQSENVSNVSRSNIGSRDGSRRLEPSPLLTTTEWDSAKASSNRVGGQSGKSTSGSEQTLSTRNDAGKLDTRSNGGGPQSDENYPFSPASPSRIDPLGPIPSQFPRPTNSGTGFMPGKSLLKDVVGRRFNSMSGAHSSTSGANSPESERKQIKGRVRFKSAGSFGSTKETRATVERRMSQASNNATDPETETGTNGATSGTAARHRADSAPDQRTTSNGHGRASESEVDGKDEEGDGTGLSTAKRKVALLLGKKVLNGFKG